MHADLSNLNMLQQQDYREKPSAIQAYLACQFSLFNLTIFE
jgi:hypothetical protein